MSDGRRPRPSTLLVPVLAAWAFLGCAGGGPAEVEGLKGDLERARERWDATGPASYRYTVTRQCFCIREALGPAVVTVRDGEVTAVTRAGSGEPVEPEYRDFFPSVEGLFEILEEAVERDADRIEVRYDPVLGSPVHVWIDYETGMADEETGFEATLPEPLG